MTNAEIIALNDRYLFPLYPRAPLALVRGQGCRVWDADGKEYLDFFASTVVTALGHCAPGRDTRHRRAGGEDPARLQSAPQRAAGAAGGAAVHALVRRPGLPLQQRRRGQRGRDQAGAQVRRRARRRALRDPHRAGLVPRAHHRHDHRDRAGEGAARLPAAAGRLPLRAVQRRRRPRSGALAAHHRRDARTAARRGRHRRAAARTTCVACASCATGVACC